MGPLHPRSPFGTIPPSWFDRVDVERVFEKSGLLPLSPPPLTLRTGPHRGHTHTHGWTNGRKPELKFLVGPRGTEAGEPDQLEPFKEF